MNKFRKLLASCAVLFTMALSGCSIIGDLITESQLKQPTIAENVLKVELEKKEKNHWYQMEASTIGINLKEKDSDLKKHIDIYLRKTDNVSGKNDKLRNDYDFKYEYNDSYTVEGVEPSLFPVTYGNDSLAAAFSLNIAKLIESTKLTEAVEGRNRIFKLDIVLQKYKEGVMPLYTEHFIVARDEVTVAETTVERYSFAKALDIKLLSESKTETVYLALDHNLAYTKAYYPILETIISDYAEQKFSISYREISDQLQELKSQDVDAETIFVDSEEETVGNVFNFHGKTDLVLGLKKTSTTEEPTNPENPVEGE